MLGIVKRFPGVVANDHVDLAVAKGEIHALLGENGAGKSTLMQILYGFHRMDAGEIRIHGETVRIDSPRDAISQGIGMVHQEFMLVQPLTVVENVVLGLKEHKGPMLDLGAASRRIRELSRQHLLGVEPEAQVGSLPIGVQQRVEILKLLYRDARLLILDEPTAVLTPPEKDRLFAVLRGLRDEGRSVLIVTHKLHEILELADRVTVMRDGRVVGSVLTSETSSNELARMMVGRDVHLSVEKSASAHGACVLSVEGLCVRDDAGVEKVRGISLDVHAGEIVGIAGVDGNGQSQLAQAVMGLCSIAAGHVQLKGEDVGSLSVAAHRERGLAYVPADRRGVGSLVEMSIAENAMLGSQRELTSGFFLSRVTMRMHARALVTRFGVRTASIDTAAGKLSGGNLQKVILGREMMREPVALVVEQPTRGLDVGAVESIWQELLRERAKGTAILLISAELEELMNLADRIAVIFEGRIVGVVDAQATTMEELGMMMAGGAAAGAA